EEEKADVVILNTCTVKGATENKIMKRIERLKNKKLIIAGCMGINENRIRKIRKNAVIVHPGALGNIVDAVKNCTSGKIRTYREIEEKDNFPREITYPIYRMPIQEGCVGNCYFCQTKIARPKLMSYNKERVISLITEAVSKGAKEIQLTGMDTGAYGIERGTTLVELLKEISEIPGEFKVRLGMINPAHAKRMIKGIIKQMSNSKFYKFIHLPVQTGSEKVCKEMNRSHTVKDFVYCVEKFRKEIPDILIATDIIVGYPTEKEEDFEETKKLLSKTKPDIVNISKFTPRPGTKAKEMKQLDSKIVKNRSSELTELSRKIALDNNRKIIGKKYTVRITEKQKDFTGRND
ncbi:MAG: tRNA (N(6)-L-threonylcarbamoyladenosine(37)-C(2))-methylthiotransferase, partial [Candidatus ainarchaeum sp.]|nr:tRNA (N(6)-L-threonylcarbamoyladenosine(37)-C(2))-methylthiotransferase [Candidatus ainarchaeum sp.]